MCQVDRIPKREQFLLSKFLENNELRISKEFIAGASCTKRGSVFPKSPIRQATAV
jgi:hypothetical protein